MPAEGYYCIIPELNNCWKCPECCDENSVSRMITVLTRDRGDIAKPGITSNSEKRSKMLANKLKIFLLKSCVHE